ncbi:GOLPH3/VPS74 family protein [Nonomuraea lactucae]|uniref:GOLPH3/VPS74 family protein n=1 Tax=Nonomuraea lactucae TaxID=2249762 RepID=UPI000DE4AAD0|nr:GPP34 family phosphoprotein [Nonomuraea lactucae]
MTVTIAEELLLLAYSEDEGKQLISATQLDPALGGAILAELAVNERIELSEKKVSVRDATPLGDEELDAALARMAEERRERRPVWWVQKLHSSKLRRRLLTRLTESGVLNEQRGKVLGVFPTTRWPEADGSVEAEVRERVAGALAGATPDARTAVLIALAHASKLDRKAFPGAGKERIREIAEGAWAADAVAKTIAAINSVIMVAAVSATVTAVDGGAGG